MEKQVITFFISGTVIILMLVAFIIWLVVFASKAFNRGKTYAEVHSLNWTSLQVDELLGEIREGKVSSAITADEWRQSKEMIETD